jgi:hypothetical protein
MVCPRATCVSGKFFIQLNLVLLYSVGFHLEELGTQGEDQRASGVQAAQMPITMPVGSVLLQAGCTEKG